MNFLNEILNIFWIKSVINFPEIVSLRFVIMFIVMGKITFEYRDSLYRFSIFYVDFVVFFSRYID